MFFTFDRKLIEKKYMGEYKNVQIYFLIIKNCYQIYKYQKFHIFFYLFSLFVNSVYWALFLFKINM